LIVRIGSVESVRNSLNQRKHNVRFRLLHATTRVEGLLKKQLLNDSGPEAECYSKNFKLFVA